MIALKKANTFIVILCIVSILSLCYNCFYKTDDYGFMLDIKQRGVIGNCINGYLNWDGRFLSLGAFFQGFLLLLFPIKFVTFFWCMCFLVSGYSMIFILKYNNPILNFHFNVVIGVTFAILFWFVSLPILYEVVYWGTGGVYSIDLLFGAIWIVLFFKMPNIKDNKFIFFVYVLFTIAVGGISQNLSVPLLTLVLITIILKYFKKDRSIYYDGLLWLSLGSGLAFIQFAPGNLIRLEALQVKQFDFSLIQIIKNSIHILMVYFMRLYILILLICVGSIFFIKEYFQIALKFKKSIFYLSNRKVKAIELLIFFKWFIVAVSSIAPFVLIPKIASARTSIFFNFFMLLFVLEVAGKFFICTGNAIITARLNKGLLVGGIVIFSVNLWFFQKGQMLQKEVATREKILATGKHKLVKVKLIDPKLNNCIYTYGDYAYPETNDNAWIKKCQEQYFNTKIIVVK